MFWLLARLFMAVNPLAAAAYKHCSGSSARRPEQSYDTAPAYHHMQSRQSSF